MNFLYRNCSAAWVVKWTRNSVLNKLMTLNINTKEDLKVELSGVSNLTIIDLLCKPLTWLTKSLISKLNMKGSQTPFGFSSS